MRHFGQKSRKHENIQEGEKEKVTMQFVRQNRYGKASVDLKSFQCFRAQMMLITSDCNSVTLLVT